MAELRFKIVRDHDEDGIPAGEYNFLYVPSLPKGHGVLGVVSIMLKNRSATPLNPGISGLVEKVAGVPAEAIKLPGFCRADAFVVTVVPSNAPTGVKAACVAFYVPGVEDVFGTANNADRAKVAIVDDNDREKNVTKLREALDNAGYIAKHTETVGYSGIKEVRHFFTLFPKPLE